MIVIGAAAGLVASLAAGRLISSQLWGVSPHDPATFLTDDASSIADVATSYGSYPTVPAEPPLECYVTASCGEGAVAAKVAKCKRKHKKGHRAEASKKRHCKKRHKKR